MAADDLTRYAPGRAPRNPISGPQIEVVISRSVAVFGLVFAAQTVPPLLEQSRGMGAVWTLAVVIAVFGALMTAVVASAVKRWVGPVNTFIVVAWFITMVTWPAFLLDPSIVVEDRPWPWYLVTVATACAAVAWPVWAATLSLFLLPVIYGLVRLSPSGGADDLLLVGLDVVYSLILGGTVLVIITLLRQAAASVDLAQSTAIDRYSLAVREHATEVERVEVDAIVHDSVLTTFLSAARADTTPAKQLAGRMAQNAMGYLRDAATTSPDGGATVPARELADRISLAQAALPIAFEVRQLEIPEVKLPANSAEAIYSAAVQAMVNSVQHAGTSADVERWVVIGSSDDGRISVEVGDSGAGFDPQTVLSARIGLRVSIVERVLGAGGEVDVQASPGSGSVIRLTWPALPTDSSARPVPDLSAWGRTNSAGGSPS